MNSPPQVKLGILGGIGPESSAVFYKRLINRLQNSGLINSNLDFPQIVLNSIPAPELLSENHMEEDLSAYLHGLKELETLSPDFIVMACNTIHFFHEKLSSQISIPILDLRKEVENHLLNNSISKVVVFGTQITTKKGLFKFKEITQVTPSEEELEIISDSIFNFLCGKEKLVQINNMKRLANKYRESGFNILVACTELSLMLENVDLNKIDTMEILLDSTMRKITECKLKNKKEKVT
jgi:aspartate racemase